MNKMKPSNTVILVFLLLGVLVLIIITQITRDQLPIQTQTKPGESVKTVNDKNLITKGFYIGESSFSKDKEVDVGESFQIKFNEAVDYNKIDIIVEPDHGFNLILDDSLTTLTIKPLAVWSFDTNYKIIITNKTKSQKDVPLDKDYEFNFKTIKYGGL